jgi:hypothetical protein
VLATARQSLGEIEYAGVWGEGQSITLEQVIAEILSEQSQEWAPSRPTQEGYGRGTSGPSWATQWSTGKWSARKARGVPSTTGCPLTPSVGVIECLSSSTVAPISACRHSIRVAPVRVRCFGAREVWSGDRLLRIGDTELLLLLGVHPVTGIQSEGWSTRSSTRSQPTAGGRSASGVSDCAGRCGGRCRSWGAIRCRPMRVRRTVVCLDPKLVSSDVHEFLELLECVRTLPPEAAIEAYEAALALYRGDLLDSSDVPSYRWMYDEGPQVSLTLCGDYRRLQREARLRLAGLLGAGDMPGLARAEELYTGLCAEEPEDEELWTALFRVHERAGSSLGLDSAVRRLRAALVEFAPKAADIEMVPLPPNLAQLVKQIRERIGGG